jgi:flagellar basal body L-ring protein FlgH
MSHKIVVLTALLALMLPMHIYAQSGAVVGTPTLLTPAGRPMKMTEASLTFQAPPRQRVFERGDIIYVHIKDKRSYSNTANNQPKKKIETSTRITGWSKFTGLF